MYAGDKVRTQAGGWGRRCTKAVNQVKGAAWWRCRQRLGTRISWPPSTPDLAPQNAAPARPPACPCLLMSASTPSHPNTLSPTSAPRGWR